ncbi:ww domain binding protein 11 [Ophiostoma piceae UAMH 11346]|uniref:Ww domain binding protein 11 n=1 Tax=Ophiostoma piceae (strain UAMH 11346) TaxID=1262450 RepID=S3CV73_OPHP1|nr:ww domain binding protein 11 [Ophiostoma piceae UAMH 11346]
MPKERNFDPVAAQRKADKAKAIKKGKAHVVEARNERLAKKNPDRISKQISDLKAITEGGGKLTSHEQQVLEGLEKELKAVTKARDALGDKAPTFGSGYDRRERRDGDDFGHGRKRRRDDDKSSSDGSDVDDEVRRIPMPRDTPPPIPRRYLDDWYAKRRAKWNAGQNTSTGNANNEPLGESRASGRRDTLTSTATPAMPTTSAAPVTLPKAQPVEIKTVYEAKPVVRDLQKEAVSKFMPTVVRRKIDKSRGRGGLLEPEEADQLEQEGYLTTTGSGGHDSAPSSVSTTTQQGTVANIPRAPHQATVEDADDDEEDG